MTNNDTPVDFEHDKKKHTLRHPNGGPIFVGYVTTDNDGPDGDNDADDQVATP